MAFSALDRGGAPPGGHLLSIERLAPDLLSSSKVNVSDFFPISYVESPSLFKRAGRYYLLSPSCCCACRGGSGLAVYSAPSILGPWALQRGDVNCNDTLVEICGAFGARTVGEGGILWSAQWWSVSTIPLAGGGAALLLNGRRWLSGEGNDPACGDMCGNLGHNAPCVNDKYELRRDVDVWLPLEFDGEGNVRCFLLLLVGGKTVKKMLHPPSARCRPGRPQAAAPRSLSTASIRAPGTAGTHTRGALGPL